MPGLFVMGLPSQLRARLEGAAKTKEIAIATVVAGIGKEGSWRLMPAPEDAIYSLTAYYEALDAFDQGFVLVLPYAPVPQEVAAEFVDLRDLGLAVEIAQEGNDGWPPLAKKADTAFLNALFDRIQQALFGEVDAKPKQIPSDFFRSIAKEHPRFIIVEGALDLCDKVAKHRWSFLEKTAAAFSRLMADNGPNRPIDQYFEEYGLALATSGGISTTLEVMRDGALLHGATENTHLKRGDNTSAIAAVRVYYQTFMVKSAFYIALFYAGPHPDGNITRRIELEPSTGRI